MNTNLRAIAFGAAVAAVLAIAMNTVTAAEPEVVRLDGITVTAHRDNFDADGNLKVVQLERVMVVAHKSVG